jgi:hypothetical protein
MSLGFLPYSELRDGDTRLRTGHLIVGIGVAGGGEMWFHSSGNIGKRAVFYLSLRFYNDGLSKVSKR